VEIPRPRDRRELIKSADFKEMKLRIVNTLLAAKRDSTATVTWTRAAPDILPEDLNVKRNHSLFDRPGPRRRSQLAREELQIEAS
jgi:hypothetical protein